MNQISKLFICLTFCLSAKLVFADTATVNFLINEYSKSANVELQIEILKTLGSYKGNPQVQATLISVISNPRLSSKLRVQSAFSLSEQTSDRSILSTILRAHDNSRDLWLRAKLLEAIYPSVLEDQKVRSVLMNNLVQNHDPLIQQASAFSLGKNIADPSIKLFLIERSESPFLRDNVRVEILKSFYTQLSDPRIMTTLNNIALSGQEPVSVRSAATRVLATAPKTRSSRQSLFDLLSRSSFESIRKQAAAGLKFELTEEDVNWMRLSVDPRSGLKRDPFTIL